MSFKSYIESLNQDFEYLCGFQHILITMFYLFGASGHGLVIQDILEDMGQKVDRYIDDSPLGDTHGQLPVQLSKELDLSDEDQMIISIGVNKNRKRVAARYNTVYATAIHPKSVVARSAQIGVGSVVMAGAVVNTNTIVGQHAIINTSACIDHECRIGDFVHVAPNATLCGGVQIGEGSYIGAGSVIIQGTKIGTWCTIGAGAVVLNNVEDGAVVVGNPARQLRIDPIDPIDPKYK